MSLCAIGVLNSHYRKGASGQYSQWSQEKGSSQPKADLWGMAQFCVWNINLDFYTAVGELGNLFSCLNDIV